MTHPAPTPAAAPKQSRNLADALSRMKAAEERPVGVRGLSGNVIVYDDWPTSYQVNWSGVVVKVKASP